MVDFIVTNTNDSGSGSLRQAILDANATTGADTISFDPNLNGQTIRLTSGELGIASDLEIQGDLDDDGLPDITVDATQTSRVFNIDDGNSTAADSIVILQGLKITGGNGSGIRNSEDLTITNSEISGNTVAYSNGAGVFNTGTFKLRNSTVKDNSVVAAGLNNIQYGSGGGIANEGDLFVSNSTISGNSAGRDYSSIGDGIFSSGRAEIVNSTISGNEEQFGTQLAFFSGRASVSSSTVLGGRNYFSNSLVSLSNSIISPVFTDRSIQTSGINFVDGGGAPKSLSLDPKLGPLQNNGGTTETHALLPDSPAIGLGDNSILPADVNDLDGDGNISEPIPFDQRGEGFDRISGSTVDVGAFEVQGTSSITPPSLKPSLTVDTLVDENDFDLTPGDVSLREAVAFVQDGGTIDFDSSLAGESILLNSSLIISKSLSIQGLGADRLTLDLNGTDRILVVDDGDDSLNQTVELSDLTLTGGSSRYFNGGGDGINNRETLTISRSHITGNGSFGTEGGGILNSEAGILTISDSTISENYAAFGGGGILNFGELIVLNSTISGNDSEYGDGVGLSNRDGATARIINSTFNETHSSYNAIDNDGGVIQIISSIVTSIENEVPTTGSIISQNSLIERGVVDIDLGGNVMGVSPNFDPTGLQDNGGPTPTIALQINSTAIDAGINPNGLLFDQRGPDFNRDIGPTDIGAFEVAIDPELSIDLELFDADTDTLIATLDEGTTVLASELVERSLNIAATIPDGSPFAGEVESIFLDLNDGDVTRTENSEPYALFGDRSGDFFRGSVPIGRNTISLDLFSENRRRGALLGTVERNFTIADDLTGLDIGLFDADTDERIMTLFDGAEVDSALLDGRKVNIAAIVSNDGPFSEQVESIFLNLNNGAVTRTENSEPYAIFGDRSGDFFGGSLPIGDNTLSFELYSDNRRRGDLIDTVSIDFTIG